MFQNLHKDLLSSLSTFLDLRDHANIMSTCQENKKIFALPTWITDHLLRFKDALKNDLVATINQSLTIASWRICETHFGNGSLVACSQCLCITCGQTCGRCNRITCAVAFDGYEHSLTMFEDTIHSCKYCESGCACSCKFVCVNGCGEVICNDCEPNGPIKCDDCEDILCNVCCDDHECELQSESNNRILKIL
jgi:hypothetical protein